MPKYQLTERQRNILRAASKGLRNGTVKAEWSWYTIPSDTGGLDFEITNGFPAANNRGILKKDLEQFAQLGLLTPIIGRKAYQVNERMLHNIVQSFH